MATTNIGTTLDISMALIVVICASCTVPFALPDDMNRRRRDDGKRFFCPAGHENAYNGSTFESLQKANAALQAQVETLEAQITQLSKSPPPEPKPKKTRARSLPGDRQAEILRFVQAAGKPISRSDIHRGLNVYPSTVYRGVDALVGAGRLKIDQRGWVSCP